MAPFIKLLKSKIEGKDMEKIWENDEKLSPTMDLLVRPAAFEVMAADASCSTGCAALEASLFNPRALAFASNQDLYFIESGSEKILKLTTSLGDPSESPPATLSTFAGHGEVSRYGCWPRNAIDFLHVSSFSSPFLPLFMLF